MSAKTVAGCSVRRERQVVIRSSLRRGRSARKPQRARRVRRPGPVACARRRSAARTGRSASSPGRRHLCPPAAHRRSGRLCRRARRCGRWRRWPRTRRGRVRLGVPPRRRLPARRGALRQRAGCGRALRWPGRRCQLRPGPRRRLSGFIGLCCIQQEAQGLASIQAVWAKRRS
jgi:hypothetical protein